MDRIGLQLGRMERQVFPPVDETAQAIPASFQRLVRLNHYGAAIKRLTPIPRPSRRLRTVAPGAHTSLEWFRSTGPHVVPRCFLDTASLQQTTEHTNTGDEPGGPGRPGQARQTPWAALLSRRKQ